MDLTLSPAKAGDFLRGWMARNIHAMKGKFTLVMQRENVITIICRDRPFWYCAGVKEKAERTYPDIVFEIEERK